VWVQLLGLDTKRHLGKTLAALGVKWRTFGNLLFQVFTKVLPNRKEKDVAKKLRPIFATITNSISSRFSELTYDELCGRFAAHEVWFTPLRAPKNLLHYGQVHDNGIILIDSMENVSVTTPVQFQA